MRVVVLLWCLAATPALAQNRFPPDSVVNLKVLPRTTPPREVVSLMRGFSMATGLRCSHCHLGEEGQPLTTYDFASDERRGKLVAREMMRMTTAINEQTIARLPERPDSSLQVTCATCHRGVSRPVPLERIIVQAAVASGPDSAVRAYRALRETYYGRAAYDFSERTLVTAAQQLSQEQRFDDALALLDLDNEFYPRGAELMLATGDVHRARGDTASAVKAYREALVRNPRSQPARQRLTQLGQQQP
jgi:tetratricopeptide (TPR) repeat protein